MNISLIIFLFILTAGVAGAYMARKLTLAGALGGGVLALALYAGSGLAGIAEMGAFFLVAVAATSRGKSFKKRLGIAEGAGGRNLAQVLANGGMGALSALLALAFPLHETPFFLMMGAAFSSAAADTVSSELGSVYGKRFWNITSFRRDQRGLDGVVSLEGLAAGLVASAVISMIHGACFGWSTFLPVLVGGTVGNLADSALGATVERKGLLQNNGVNFINTAIAAGAAVLLWLLTGQ